MVLLEHVKTSFLRTHMSAYWRQNLNFHCRQTKPLPVLNL